MKYYEYGTENKKLTHALFCGLLGGLCMGTGDWLMIYGDTAHTGAISWLTLGVAQIAPWRNNLAMALAFPGVILYGFAWMSGNGYASAALPVSEAVFSHFAWLVLVSEALMLPP